MPYHAIKWFFSNPFPPDQRPDWFPGAAKSIVFEQPVSAEDARSEFQKRFGHKHDGDIYTLPS